MSEQDDNKPADEASKISAQPSAAIPALAEIAAPPLSPGETSHEIPMVEAPEHIASAEPAEAEVIMLPAKFAAFLATTASRFHERSMMLPSAGRRATAAALVATIAYASALGGAMFSADRATSAADRSEQAEQVRAVRETVARIESELTGLRGNIERTAKLSVANAGKTGERLDRIEKAQAEPSARLARLTESVEKLRTAAPATAPAVTVAAAAPAAAVTPAREVTGSIAPQPAAKSEPLKPAIVEGWVIRDAAQGTALIEGRSGLLEVYVGDSIPGVGRVDAVRRQDGKWVVVTAKGLIVTR